MTGPRPLSYPALWNMNFGFLGIQLGWGLQMANMSPIYKYLGAADDQIARLWLAAPLTGLIVQPIVGAMSDRTWGRLGRRRPYFLVGAILSALALVLMPNSGSLAEALVPHWPKFYVAALLLWVLDASINVSMEPFRAFVADKLPQEQRATGFAMQSFFIGVGAVIAGLLPYVLRHWFGVSADTDGANALPTNVKISFYVGAAAFFGAVLWTVISTREEPPPDLAAFRRRQTGGGFGPMGREIWDALMHMPRLMRRLAVVQFFTWLGLFCMWLHFSNAVPVIFGSGDPETEVFKRGAEWAGVCYAVKDAVTFVTALALMIVGGRWARHRIHGVCLTLGGLGLLAIGAIQGEAQRHLLLGALALGGIAWASILSMPYAMLSSALPAERVGVYMGIFNFFIVLPEILAALFFGPLVKDLLGGNLIHAVMLGGGCLLLAAALTFFWVREDLPIRT